MLKHIVKHDTTIKHNGHEIGLMSQYQYRHRKRMYKYNVDGKRWSDWITLKKVNSYLKKYDVRVTTK